MPKISVVIPAHNSARYLPQAINSVLEQTFNDLEILVVDDGSTDNTGHALAPYLERIRLITQPHLGLSAARNAAIEASTGELVALLDADDLWLPTRLESLVSFMEANPELGFSTSDAYLLRGDKATTQTYYSALPRRQRFRTKNQSYWIVHTNFVFVMTMIRRELFDQHGLFEGTFGEEDWNLWIRFLIGGEKVGLLDEPLAYYRLHEGQMSADRPRAERMWINALEGAARACGPAAIERGIRGRIEFLRGKVALAEGRHQDAKSHFSRALSDSALDGPTRAKALLASRLPGISWSLYARLRNRRRFD